MATFQTLPTELVLRICHTLDTADVVRLSEASRFLNQLCRSSDVWKSRTRELWALYGLGGDDLDSNSELLDWTGWRDLLGPYRKYLGWLSSHSCMRSLHSQALQRLTQSVSFVLKQVFGLHICRSEVV